MAGKIYWRSGLGAAIALVALSYVVGAVLGVLTLQEGIRAIAAYPRAEIDAKLLWDTLMMLVFIAGGAAFAFLYDKIPGRSTLSKSLVFNLIANFAVYSIDYLAAAITGWNFLKISFVQIDPILFAASFPVDVFVFARAFDYLRAREEENAGGGRPQLATASLKRRFAAYLIDWSALMAFLFVILLLILALFTVAKLFHSAIFLFAIAIIILFFSALIVNAAYWSHYESNGRQTLGKRLLGIRVVQADGAPASARQALVRNLWKYVPFIGIFGVPDTLYALANGGRKRFLDEVAGTRVVKGVPNKGGIQGPMGGKLMRQARQAGGDKAHAGRPSGRKGQQASRQLRMAKKPSWRENQKRKLR